MKLLITGGAGYIGSHTAVELLADGHDVVIVDDLSNSSREVLRRIEAISGRKVTFYQRNILDTDAMRDIFAKEVVDGVIHFAAFKAVGESVEKPLEYYHNNITGTIQLLHLMRQFDVKRFILSSSATVYGMENPSPLNESMPIGQATNPYGYTKIVNEQLLQDLYRAEPDWSIVLLRYFNPIGAHESGQIGENPNGVPNNLMPYVTQVAIGKLEQVHVYGDDYPTPDGTGVRDYIHVVDLAKGHMAALRDFDKAGLTTYNLGTGEGYSVLDLIHAFEKANDIKIPYQIDGRRAGDVAVCYADPSKAQEELAWTAQYDLEDMCRDSWRWQSQNPNGYEA
ncbi:UDP-glucose 4-epimerase GalE [Suicoccus acidiformans]|uniref:UDP-glucose 4-epimerase n=1 Tax=Suicoccus acidiformans TaxID=2036206 RepID=A0A347WIC2_9LACT|nr:UDP-glucose 4-epimerase GalE [Suicoccus acidiformans]AXY24829.1 UDP-glucose 4-epimerase GalE [Suicoccus acidiformans]